MRISEKERLVELYFCLKSVPDGLWNTEDYEIVRDALSEKKLNTHQSMSFHILGRLAHKVSDGDEFYRVIKSERLPNDLIFNNEEFELLNQGLKKAAKNISKGAIGNAEDSLKIFQFYYAKAS